MKKLISSAVVLSLLLALCACAAKPEVDKAPDSNSTNGEWRLKEKRYSLPEGMAVYTRLCAAEDKLFLGGMDENSLAVFGKSDFDGSGAELISLPRDCEYIHAMCQTKDGISILAGDYPQGYTDVNGSFCEGASPSELYIFDFNFSGSLLRELPVEPVSGENGRTPSINGMAKSEEGYFLIGSPFVLYLDDSGALTAKVDREDGATMFTSILNYNGDILVAQSNRFGSPKPSSAILRFDSAEKSLTSLLSLEDVIISGMGVGKSGELLLSDENELSSINLESGEDSRLISYIDAGLSAPYFDFIHELESGYILGSNGTEITEFSFEFSAVARREITLATDSAGLVIGQLVSEFNKTSTDYLIKMTDYGSGEKSMDLLRTEILAGKIPDIFAFSWQELEGVDKSVYFLDLLPLFDEKSGISIADLNEAIVKGVKTKGAIYELPLSYQYYSFSAPYELVGEKAALTMAEAQELAKRLGPDTLVFPGWMDRDIVWSWVGRFAEVKYIDKENGTCSFNCDEFIELLELCKTHILPIPEGTTEAAPRPEGLLSLVAVQSIDSLMQQNKKSLSVVGFPDGGGTGLLFPLNMISISSKAENSDGAWEFLKFALSNRGQALLDGLPVSNLAFDRQAEQALKGKFETFYGQIVKLSQEDIDLTRKVLNRGGYYSKTGGAVTTILLEEVGRFYGGECSAQECAKIIDERIGLFLAEHS